MGTGLAPEARAAALPTGESGALRLADRWVLRTPVGRGGMAAVYRAWDEHRGEIVAVKVLYPGMSKERHIRRLAREGATMRDLAHPNVPAVVGTGCDDLNGLHYLAMEYAALGSAARLQRLAGPLAIGEVCSWAVQVLCALSQVHALGMVHRDVKPSNILLAADGRAMLGDFGIVWTPIDEAEGGRNFSVGTVAYMAPEQTHAAGMLGPRSDLYGMGATLYALLTGDSPSRLFEANATDRRWEALPPSLRRTVYRATRRDPMERQLDARALAVELSPHVPTVLYDSQPHIACWIG